METPADQNLQAHNEAIRNVMRILDAGEKSIRFEMERLGIGCNETELRAAIAKAESRP